MFTAPGCLWGKTNTTRETGFGPESFEFGA
jgi:hypothetical protein